MRAMGRRPLPVEEFPAGAAQQSRLRRWFENPSTELLVIGLAFDLKGPVDVGALTGAVRFVVERHVALRTAFAMRGDTVVHVPVDAPLEPVPVPPPHPEGWLPDTARAAAVDEAGRRLDPMTGPLLRVSLFVVDSDHHFLSITLSHLVADGWSTGILLREIGLAYGRLVRGETLPAETPPQLPEWTRQQQDRLEGDQLARLADFWRGKLGPDPTALFVRFPDEAEVGAPAGRLHARLPDDVSSRARRVASESRVTLFVVLLSCFFDVLHGELDRDDLTVVTSYANRDTARSDAVVGCLTSRMFITTAWDAAGDQARRLRQTQKAVFACAAHAAAPFALVQELAWGPRAAAFDDSFVPYFVLNDAADTRLELEGVRAEPVELPAEYEPQTLELWITKDDEDLVVDVLYAARQSETAPRILERFADRMARL